MKIREDTLMRNARYTFKLAWNRCKKLGRLVRWANRDKILGIYLSCQMKNWESKKTKYQVDHIIPLQNNMVSGLHNEFNLQIIPKDTNKNKGNIFIPYRQITVIIKGKIQIRTYYYKELASGTSYREQIKVKKRRKKPIMRNSVEKMSKNLLKLGKNRLKTGKKLYK